MVPNTARTDTHVAIIGAGIAGLTCARRLHHEGFKVTLFDKGRGPGGRLCTRRRDSGHFDHGAQYLTAHSPAFQEEIARWAKDGIIAPWTGRFAMGSRESLKAIEPHRVRWVGTPRMSAIGRYLARDLDLQLGTRVGSLAFDHNEWTVHHEDGHLLGRFNTVILTCPGPQSYALIPQDLTLRVEAKHLRYAPCWTAMLSFERPIPLPFDGIQLEDSPIGWMARNNSKPGRPDRECWVVQGSPKWSEETVDAPLSQVQTELLTAFAEITGERPSTVDCHRWLYALAEAPNGEIANYDARHRLGLGGDGTEAPRVEGAWLSGWKLAERVSKDPQYTC